MGAIAAPAAAVEADADAGPAANLDLLWATEGGAAVTAAADEDDDEDFKIALDKGAKDVVVAGVLAAWGV